MNKSDIPTPALLLDINVLKNNIKMMSDYLRDKNAYLRPHIKCHKTPQIAKMQIDAGAQGVMVAKLGEAEEMVKAGTKDIAIANQVVQKAKIEHLAELSHQSDISVAVDNPEVIDTMGNVATAEGANIRTIVEVDVGMGRCGVRPGENALKLVEKVNKTKGMVFVGLMGYEGLAAYEPALEDRKKRCYESYKKLVDTVHLVERNGITVDIVSAGATTSFSIAAEYPGITEIEAGSYVLMDRAHKMEGVPFNYALSVLTTVISKPTIDRAIIDGGLKTFSETEGLPKTEDIAGIEFNKLDEEHGYLRLKNQSSRLKVGDMIEFIPAYSATTVNLHDKFYVTEGDNVKNIWKITARGRVD